MKVSINVVGVKDTDLQHLLNRMRKSKFNLTLNSTNRVVRRVYAKDIPEDKVDSIATYCQSIGAGLAVIK